MRGAGGGGGGGVKAELFLNWFVNVLVEFLVHWLWSRSQSVQSRFLKLDMQKEAWRDICEQPQEKCGETYVNNYKGSVERHM